MSLTLTVLLSLISAAILAGRVYEILNLTDAATGFLLVGGVVMNPYILALVAVITLCCGIIIFSQYKVVEPYYSHTSKYTAFIAGAAMAVAGILAAPYKVEAPFFIAGGMALLIMAGAGLGKKKSDYLVMVLLLAFAAGLCMDVVTFNVFTYHNTQFLTKVLSYMCIIAFMLTVLKNVYVPSKFSRMMIYVAGMLSFAACSMMSLADIICYIIEGGQSLVYLLMKIAVALFGVYAFDNAVSAIPDKKEISKAKKKIEAKRFAAPEETAEKGSNAVQEKDKVVQHTEASLKAESNNQEKGFVDTFAGAELAQMFDDFAEEKSEHIQQNDTSAEYLAEKVVLKENAEDEVLKYEMFSELFGSDTKTEISVPQPQGILSETRSFKRFAAPKLDETAPEYDMLKSMFRGEDTSQYDVPQAEETKADKKRSLFGAKKEKSVKIKETALKSERKEDTVLKQPELPDKKTFAAAQPKVSKTKNDTKKVVYKKPK